MDIPTNQTKYCLKCLVDVKPIRQRRELVCPVCGLIIGELSVEEVFHNTHRSRGTGFGTEENKTPRRSTGW